jgi:hypothetical protein
MDCQGNGIEPAGEGDGNQSMNSQCLVRSHLAPCTASTISGPRESFQFGWDFKAQIILFHQNPAVIFLQTKERSHPSPAGTNLADLAGDLAVSREVLKGNEQFISFFVMQANGYDSVAPNRKRFVGTNAMQASTGSKLVLKNIRWQECL